MTISDVDQLLLSEGADFVRYSDDFRIFAKSEADAYRKLTIVARALFGNHGLTLQQHKTKVLPIGIFRSAYLKENEKRELETLSEKFYQLLEQLGIEDTYEEIDYDSLDDEQKEIVDQLNLEGILRHQIDAEEPDLSLLKFLLRRLGQLGDADVVELIFDNFDCFVPVIRETIEYLLKLRHVSKKDKANYGGRLLDVYRDADGKASHLEYSRMYLLHPFAVDGDWNQDDQYVKLYGEAVDDFGRRELLLSLGRSKKDFWFRGRKQYLQDLTSWSRRAFIYGASCLPTDEYKHWIRGIDGQLDDVERAVASWARKKPIC